MVPVQKSPANVSISSDSQSGGVPVWRRSGRHGDETDCIIGSAAVWRDRRTEGRRDRQTDGQTVSRTWHVLPPPCYTTSGSAPPRKPFDHEAPAVRQDHVVHLWQRYAVKSQ